MKKQIESEIKKQRDLFKLEIKEHVASLKYKTHIADMRDLLKSSINDKYEQKKENKKKMIDKVDNYAKYVKEMYWPKVSEKKKHELDAIKGSIKHVGLRKSSSGMIRQPISSGYDDTRDIDDEYRTLPNDVSSMPNLHLAESPIYSVQSQKKSNL